eukprot:TRINITY_DN26306_c0_g1_i1.p3 TRINITY_DN26306_c0_g1~~TRINITY_DN26306_c0_g1_i1.p3  ORF type:complete len:122 (+),score=21.81 TRINITY_DN26306_c0_g1_i1:129-494(+)
MAATLIAPCGLSVAAIATTSAPKRVSASVKAPSVAAFSGLRASSRTSVLSEKKSVDEEFAQISASFRQRNGSRGGALSSECNLAGEIFGTIPIICGLTLIGVALGFVLIRVETAVEEAAEK